jgi:hypothetical protein
MREPGMLHDPLVARVDALEAALNTARVDDFAVENDRRTTTDVARDMLRQAGWL